MPYVPCRTFLLAISLMLFYPGIGSCDNPEYRSQLLPSNEQASDKLSRIARYVIERGDNEKREFVVLTLGAMIEAYSQVLQRSYQSTSRTAAERKKKISWGWATSRIIASLNNDLRKIESGVKFSLFVDHLQQIMIILEGRTIIASGPHTTSQSLFEQQVVEYFCINRDCSWLDPEPAPELSKEEAAVKRSLSKGAWYFQQETGPIFVIGGQIYFEFPDFSARKSKAELCHEIVDEVEQFITTAHEIKESNKSIDWPGILQSQPTTDNPAIELIPGESKYDIQPTQLSRLGDADWKRLVIWLQNNGFESGERLMFKQLKHLLERDNPGE